MIFVTVGTHEQPMDRLFGAMEDLIERGQVEGPVFVQCGYTQFRFRHCEARDLLPYEDIERKMKEAEIVVTHGGPATIMQIRMQGKVPIVVPRQHRFGEHVNDHQVDFCRRLESMGLVRAVYDIAYLAAALKDARGPKPLASASPSGLGLGRDQLCQRLTQYCRALETS